MTRKLRRKALFLSFVACNLAQPFAFAHEDDEIEEIVVLGRWDRPNGLTVSASQGFVSQADFSVRPMLRPGDILEVVPGLIVTQHSGTGKSNQMFLRGFNLDHGTDFATWIDGMPINMPTHGHGQGYTDLNFIIPELVHSVEFRKGPYYADVSDFSSAGAAFFSTARKLDSGMVKTGIGKDNFAQVLYADSFSTGRGDLLFGVQYNQYDGPWVGTSEDLNRYNGLIRYTESTPGVGEWGVTLMAYDASWNSADQIPRRAVESGEVSRLGTIDDTVGGETSRYSLSGRWHRDFGVQQVTARAYAIDYKLDLFSNFSYFLGNPVDGDQFEQLDERKVFGGDVLWRINQSDTLTHEMGIAIRYDDIDELGLFESTGRARGDAIRFDRVQQMSTGLHYTLEVAWSDVWKTSFGVRADHFDFDVRDSNIPENTGTADDWMVSPKLNVVRVLSDEAEAYFSAGYAFHSNDARGTVITTDPSTGEPAQPVDPLVRSRGAEVGMRFFREERLNVSAALWVLELDSELLFIGDAGGTEPSRASRRYGIELPVYYRYSENLLLDLEIALTESEFTEFDAAGDEIPGSLSTVVGAGALARFDNDFYATLRVRHFGDRPLVEDGTVRSDDSTVWNAGLGYKVGNFEFRLDVLNLFDSEDDDITYFYESRLPGEPVGGFEDVHFHPIEPRTYRFYVTWFRNP
jgi:hypothetical protein